MTTGTRASRPITGLGGLRAVRWSIAIVAVVVWNLFFAVAIWLNGGTGQVNDRRALGVVAAACLVLALSALLVATSRRARSIVVHPGRAHHYSPFSFVIVGVVALVLGVSALAGFLG